MAYDKKYDNPKVIHPPQTAEKNYKRRTPDGEPDLPAQPTKPRQAAQTQKERNWQLPISLFNFLQKI